MLLTPNRLKQEAKMNVSRTVIGYCLSRQMECNMKDVMMNFTSHFMTG